MKTNAFSFLALFALAFCAVLNWSCRPSVSSPQLPPVKTVELRQTLEKCSSEPEIQSEVDSLFSRFGDKNRQDAAEEASNGADSIGWRAGSGETSAPLVFVSWL